MRLPFIAALAAVPAVGFTTMNVAELPPWKLAASRDSFVININGQKMGAAVLSVVPLPSGFRVIESTRIGTMVEQTTEILLDLEQRILSVTQSGRLRGQDARIELRYGGKRVKGTASIPGPDGPKSHDVDSAVPDDVLDDNLLHTVIGLLPWSDDATYTIPTFSAGKNALMDVKLRVVGQERVELPNGEIEAYRIEMRADGESVTHFHVSTSPPQRVLKVAAAGSGFEMVRAN